MKSLHSGLLAAASLLFAPVAAHALQATQQFNVSASVASQCSFTGTNTGINFGQIANLSTTPVQGQGSFQLQCSSGAAYKIGINAGAGTGATITERRLMSGTNTLIYKLFKDAARSQDWGNDFTKPAEFVAGTGNGAVQTITVFGTIPASPVNPASPPAGAYADAVTVTIDF